MGWGETLAGIFFIVYFVAFVVFVYFFLDKLFKALDKMGKK